MENKVFYAHFREHLQQPSRDITVAFRLKPSPYPNKVMLDYGLAYCSSNDNFCKKFGRELAEKRMNDGDNGHIPVAGSILLINDPTMNTIKNAKETIANRIGYFLYHEHNCPVEFRNMLPWLSKNHSNRLISMKLK